MSASKQTMRDAMQSLRSRFEALSPEERIELLLRAVEPEGRFTNKFITEQVVLESITRTSLNTANVVYTFPVDKFYCNNSGNMHGGFQSTAFDMLTSLAMMCCATPGSAFIDGGVSRTLNVTYLRPAPMGEELRMECEVTHVGKRMAMSRALLKRQRDGAVISTCEHNKASVEGGKPGWNDKPSNL